ncbi:MAG: Ig domain-containing protein [Phycisphaerae bacterium]
MMAVRGIGVCAGLLVLLLVPACMGPPLLFAVTELAEGVVGDSYQQMLSVVESDRAVAFSRAGGSLPPGLTLSESGRISGVPTTPGTFTFSVLADNRDLNRRSGTESFVIIIREPLDFDSEMPAARVDVPYTFSLDITGGLPPYDIEIVGLPAGFSLDRGSESIRGTPIVGNSGATVEITVRDDSFPGQTLTRRATLVVKPRAVEITTAALESGTVNQSYSVQLSAINGRVPYTWSITEGVLPQGLRLNRTTGVISGTPTLAGESTIVVRVTDADAPASSDQATYTITIEVSDEL